MRLSVLVKAKCRNMQYSKRNYLYVVNNMKPTWSLENILW